MTPNRTRRRVAGSVALAVLLAAWTVAALWLYVLSSFGALDTRCGGVRPRLSQPWGAIGVATALVWAVPFVALACWQRRAAFVVGALICVGFGDFCAWRLGAHPQAFCF